MMPLLMPGLSMSVSVRLCDTSRRVEPVKHVSAGGPSTYPTDRKCVVIRKSDDVGVVGVHPASDQFQRQAPTRTMSSVLKCGHVRHCAQNCRWLLRRLLVIKKEYGYAARTG